MAPGHVVPHSSRSAEKWLYRRAEVGATPTQANRTYKEVARRIGLSLYVLAGLAVRVLDLQASETGKKPDELWRKVLAHCKDV